MGVERGVATNRKSLRKSPVNYNRDRHFLLGKEFSYVLPNPPPPPSLFSRMDYWNGLLECPLTLISRKNPIGVWDSVYLAELNSILTFLPSSSLYIALVMPGGGGGGRGKGGGGGGGGGGLRSHIHNTYT